MSIDKHKWSDSDAEFIWAGGLNNSFCIKISSGDLIINKQDAIAIAKHFNVDRESLVDGIKKIIDIDVRRWTKYGKGLSRDEIMMCLQKLITKEDIEE
jgi:hypothetical protein